MILFIFNNFIKFSYTHYCVNQCVVRHAMATVRNFKVTKTTNMTIQPTLRKNKRAAKPTHISRHTFAAHLFLPQRPMPTHHPKKPRQ
jgi:hypothetical protein